MRRRSLIILITSIALAGVLAVIGAVFAGSVFLGVLGDAAADIEGGETSTSSDTPAAWAGTPYAEPVGYTVRDRELYETDSGEPADADLAAAWSLFATIAGDRIDEAKTVAVSDDDDESTMASVARDPEDPRAWAVEINMAYAGDPAELERTMVHEYAHMVSLSADDARFVEGACPSFKFSEGCLEEQSVLSRFIAEFWSADTVGAQAEAATEDDATRRFEDEGAARTFVSEYAATNGAEDFAETFATFVVTWPDADLPAGSVAESKVLFLADGPAMVAERDRIREGLGL